MVELPCFFVPKHLLAPLRLSRPWAEGRRGEKLSQKVWGLAHLANVNGPFDVLIRRDSMMTKWSCWRFDKRICVVVFVRLRPLVKLEKCSRIENFWSLHKDLEVCYALVWSYSRFRKMILSNIFRTDSSNTINSNYYCMHIILSYIHWFLENDG